MAPDCINLSFYHGFFFVFVFSNYLQTSNISNTLAGNKTAGHSDVVGAPPVGAAPTSSSFST